MTRKELALAALAAALAAVPARAVQVAGRAEPQDLEAVRRELRTIPRGTEIDGLIERFESGELSIGELTLEARVIDPDLALRDRVLAELPDQRLEWRAPEPGASTDVAIARFDPAGGERALEAFKVSEDRAFVKLDPWIEDDPARYRFARGEEELTPVGGGVELEPGDLVWWYDTQQPRTLTPSTEPQILCGALVNLGRAGGGLDVRLLEVWASFATAPLVWDTARTAYSTTVKLGLRVGAGATTPATLPHPITVDLEARGAGASVAPLEVELAEIGRGAANARFDIGRRGTGFALVSRLGGQPFQHPIEIAPATAALRLVPAALASPGLGLSEVALTVERLAEDGEVHAGDHELTVTLTASGGILTGSPVTLAAGTSTAEGPALRAHGIGTIVVTASAGGLASEPLPIRFAWPWALLLVSLAAGAVGGLVRPQGPLEERPVVRAAVGAVTGLVVVLAVLTGLATFGIPVPDMVGTIGGALVVGAVGGFAGRKVFEVLAGRLGLGGDGAAGPGGAEPAAGDG